MTSRRTRRVASSSTLENDDEKASNCNGSERSEPQSRAGVFKRLRYNLSRQLSTDTSPVSAVKLCPVESSRNNIKITQIQRRPLYRCVSLPPGFIPSEVLLITDKQTQTLPPASPFTENVMGNQSPGKMHGIKKTRVENQRDTETLSENGVGASKEECKQRDVLPEVMYNNWVDPEPSTC